MPDGFSPKEPSLYFKNFNLKHSGLPDWAMSYMYSVAATRTKRTTYNYAENILLFLHWWQLDQSGADYDPDTFNTRNAMLVPFECLEKLTEQDMIRFMAFCKNTLNHAPATINARMVTLHMMLDYYINIEHKIARNVARNCNMAKNDKKLPVYMQVDEYQALLKSVSGRNQERDYCILVCLLTTGLRASELVNLDVDSFNSDGQFRVFGKGHKERLLTMNDDFMDALYDYLPVREEIIAKVKEQGTWKPDEDALFLGSLKGGRITVRSVEMILEKYLAISGLQGKGYTPHKLRHTYATRLMDQGVAMPEIQKILGHEKLDTTEIYTHVTDSSVRDTMSRFSLDDKK